MLSEVQGHRYNHILVYKVKFGLGSWSVGNLISLALMWKVNKVSPLSCYTVGHRQVDSGRLLASGSSCSEELQGPRGAIWSGSDWGSYPDISLHTHSKSIYKGEHPLQPLQCLRENDLAYPSQGKSHPCMVREMLTMSKTLWYLPKVQVRECQAGKVACWERCFPAWWSTFWSWNPWGGGRRERTLQFSSTHMSEHVCLSPPNTNKHI